MARLENASDAIIRRMQKELEERRQATLGIIETAEKAKRDLNNAEKETLEGLRTRMGELEDQLSQLQSTSDAAERAAQKMKQFDQAITMVRRKAEEDKIAYRSAGEWALDSYRASIGDRHAAQRLEEFWRVADHQTTPDNLGVIPDPIVGSVINFIDAARPLVSFIGPMGMPSATWHRPRVTQQPAVAPQGYAGGADDEKQELVSQKMLISRVTANAVTYGGYVNVSRQNIDFSTPQVLDLIISGLASQYAIQTEAALAAELSATLTSPVSYTADAASVAAAIWQAVGVIYAATKGQGRLGIAVAPDVLGVFGPLFAPINPQSAQSPGFTAGTFGQGVMGSIGGVPVIMSAGLASGEAFAFSTAAIEAFEQRVGTLQVTEPSVLGVQVAYAGYFTALTIEDDAIVPLTQTS